CAAAERSNITGVTIIAVSLGVETLRVLYAHQPRREWLRSFERLWSTADSQARRNLDSLDTRPLLFESFAHLDPRLAASFARRHSQDEGFRSLETQLSRLTRRLLVHPSKPPIVDQAAKSRLSDQQPSPESRANSNARGRNYSARSVKRTPLSGSPASSKKRSSTA